MTDLRNAPIGVFDSGVGGLSVLRHIRAQLPDEELLYFADSAYSPYGGKTEEFVAERSLAIADFLVGQGAKALVVACNTATIAAIKKVRSHYPDLPIVGVEPGLKPGAAATRNGKVGVIATERALRGEKFLLLRDQISAASNATFLLQGCPGLADQIELGELDTDATRALLERFIVPLLDQDADTLVLGCTHYPFVLAAIDAIIARSGKDVVLIDTGDAVARQLARLLAAAGTLRPEGDVTGGLQGFTTGSGPALALAFSSLLGLRIAVREVEIGSPQAISAGTRI